MLVGLMLLAAPASAQVTPTPTTPPPDDNPSVRVGAATALGALGSSARAAVPALRAALDDPDAGVREAAAQALQRIQPE